MTEEEEASLRQSGRLANKQKINGNKKTEELAQEVLAKKLGILSQNKDEEMEARTKVAKLFEEPLPKEALQAMEDLLQAMNIQGKKGKAKNVKEMARKTK